MGGRVVDDATDAPIPGVVLTLLNVAGEAVASGLTGPDGAFHIRAPRSGYFRLRGDRIGYATTDSELVALLAADTTIVEFRLTEAPVTLPALRVSTTRHEIFEPLAQRGYYDRRELYQEKMGTALFLDSDQIDALGVFELAQVVREARGYRTTYRGGRSDVALRGGGRPPIYINGIRQRLDREGPRVSINHVITPSNVGGIEMYWGSSPAQFGGGAAIVIWTRSWK